ncbi:ricin-type beta-trefoil lectin domain protein [Kitasatospora sp. P5_F3]
MAAATALVLAALSSPVAWALATPMPTPSTGTNTSAEAEKPADSAKTKAIRDAFAKAATTGKPVAIDALTTETTETFADPDGHTLSSDARAQDVRTKRNGTWETLDATLRAGADGTVTPALTGSDLVLSGGGTGPLATITTAEGKKLSIGAPFALPKPTLSGSTATYASVLPDVDLEVTARPDGGWRDVIVVKTPQAAADPRLATLHFPLQTTGLKVATDAAGNVSLTDDKGKVRVHAPTPFQWDSTPTPAPSPVVESGQGAPKSLFAAPGAVDQQAEADTSTTKQPGAGATVSAMKVAASDSELVLTPDPTTFGKGTGPWYLDPEASVDNGRQVNAQVQENHPDTANVNTLNDLGVGYCGYSDCTGYGRYRSYYQLSTPSGLFEGDGHGTAKINRSTLYVDVTGAASPGTKSTINVYSAPAFQGTTTWNNQPCGTNGKMVGCTWAGNYDITGTGTMAYDVAWWMQKIVNERIPNWTIGFSAENEYDKLLRHHLGANPHVVTYYDIAPTIWSPRTTPAPGYINDPAFGTQHNDCVTPGGSAWYAPGWVGANQYVYLNASNWSPIGAGLNTTFHVWDDNNGSWSLFPQTGWTGSYGSVTVSVGNLTDGHQYGWTANATDGSLNSGDTPWCYFRVDKTPPQVSITSTDFPASGTLNATPAKKVRETGTFTVTGTDPAPASGLNASGVACIRWSTNPTAVTGWTCNDASDANGGIVKSANGTFDFKPTLWGTNTVFVQAMDVAGNYSQPLPYTFYAPWDPAIGTGTPGDLTSDGRGDILLPDDLGNLRVMTLDNDATTAQAAPLGLAPGSSTWKDDPAGGLTVKTTHRGALRSMAVDDSFVWTNAVVAGAPLANNLYLYENQGNGTFKSPQSLAKPGTWADLNGNAVTPAPAGWTANWSNLTQVVAFGAPTVGLKTSDGIVRKNQTAVLTVESGNLWLYRPNTTNHLDAPAVKVSSANWDNYELINPGVAAGLITVTNADQTTTGYSLPTLWTRDKSDGTIRAYDLKLKADRTLDLTNLTDPLTNARVVGTKKFTTTTYPRIGSSGDANKDGTTDLWTIDSANHLKVWPGVTTGGTSATAVTSFSSTAADQGDTRRFVDRFKLDNATVWDVYSKYNPTPSAPVTFPTETVNGKSTVVAHFAGKATSADPDPGSVIDYPAANSKFTVDTNKSFTATVWAKPSNADGSLQGPVLSTKGTASSGFILWPDKDGNWHFALATSDNASWNYDMTSSSATNAARFQKDRWDRLTVSYNAGTAVMTLYVNGTLAGSAIHSGKFGVNGQLVVGNYQNAGAYVSSFNGSVSDIVVYDFPTDAASTTGAIVADVSANVGVSLTTNKCVDVAGGTDADGTAIQVYDCNGTTTQNATAQSNGTIKLKTRCLDVNGAGTVNTTKVQLWTCHGGPSQQWVVRPDGSLYNPNSNKCLDIPNGNTANGTQLWIYDCNQSYAQRWRTTGVVA